jgi:hypothetical protein
MRSAGRHMGATLGGCAEEGEESIQGLDRVREVTPRCQEQRLGQSVIHEVNHSCVGVNYRTSRAAATIQRYSD